MVLDSNIATHPAIDHQFTVHEQVLILINIISSLSVIRSVDPTDSIVVHILVIYRISAALTTNINTLAAVGTRTDIELVLFVLQLDVEIETTISRHLVLISIAGKA